MASDLGQGVGGGANPGENPGTLIRSIRVKNFKTLRDVTLPFAEGLTVFVGANNSGKSNALQLLGVIAGAAKEGVHNALDRLGGLDEVRTRGIAERIEYQVEAQ